MNAMQTTSANIPMSDPNEIRRALTAIIAPGDVTELRALECVTRANNRPHTFTGYFNDPEKLIAAAGQILQATAVYFIPNPIDPALLARAVNRAKAVFTKGTSTTDANITRRRWLLVDADAERPAQISSTDAEHDTAIERAQIIVSSLAAEGWPEPIVGDSGNGAHLMYAIDEAVEDDGLVARVLAALHQRFGDEAVKIDQTVFNPARIWKLYGTKACKGDDAPELGRRHRMAKLLSVPEKLIKVTTAQLTSLAGESPTTPAPIRPPARNHAGSNLQTLDVGAWLQQHGIGATGPDDWTPRGGGRAKRWILDQCPKNSGHNKGESFVMQFANGAIDAGCHHNSCKGWGWAELREMYEPGKGRNWTPDRKNTRPRKPEPTPPNPPASDNHRERAVSTATDMEIASMAAPGEVEIWTELGNAQRLVARHGESFRYCPQTGKLLVWNGQRWIDDDGGQVERYAKGVARSLWRELEDLPENDPRRKVLVKHVLKSETAAGISAIVRLAKTEAGVSVPATDFDADQMIINTPNGTVDLRSTEIYPHRPADLITKITACGYDPDMPTPIFDGFLKRIMAENESLIGYLRRIVGYFLSGDISVQEFYIFCGGGANGKSVLVDLLMWLMGDYAGSSPPGLLTMRSNDEHPTEIADLKGKRFIVGSETEENAKLRVQLVKRLTGDSDLKARLMRQDYFQFRRTCKIVLVTNNRPVIREATNAIWRRIRLVPFNVTIPAEEQDANLLDKLKAEGPGILAWAVRGCVEWQQRGMDAPEEVKLATSVYQSEQDPLADFISDRCVRGSEAVKVTRNDLYSAYQSWCVQTGEKHGLERNSLFERIRKVQGVADAQWRPLGVTAPARGFRGIGLAALNDPSEQPQEEECSSL
jgi:P4 family phage/plasmid primase-like protien